MRKLVGLAIAVAVSLSISSCSTTHAVQKASAEPTKTVLKSYTGRVEKEKVSMEFKKLEWLHNQDNAVPVILPPVVRPVWVVDHVTPEGVFIRGHWAFLKVRGFEWYIQAIQNDENPLELIRESR